MTQREPAPLNYAVLPTPWLHRKRVRRLLLATVLIGVVVTGWRWGPPAWRAARFRYAERECLSYTAPANQLVYEDGLPAASLLWDDSQPIGSRPSVSSTFPEVMTRVASGAGTSCKRRGADRAGFTTPSCSCTDAKMLRASSGLWA